VILIYLFIFLAPEKIEIVRSSSIHSSPDAQDLDRWRPRSQIEEAAAAERAEVAVAAV
jgi:hypothetical protein